MSLPGQTISPAKSTPATVSPAFSLLAAQRVGSGPPASLVPWPPTGLVSCQEGRQGPPEEPSSQREALSQVNASYIWVVSKLVRCSRTEDSALGNDVCPIGYAQ